MVDLKAVESSGKEETPREPILGFFSTKWGNEAGFLVHYGPQL